MVTGFRRRRRATCAAQRLAILEYARAHDLRVDDFIEATASRQASEKRRRLDELTRALPVRRPVGRRRTLPARPVAWVRSWPSSTPSPRRMLGASDEPFVEPTAADNKDMCQRSFDEALRLELDHALTGTVSAPDSSR